MTYDALNATLHEQAQVLRAVVRDQLKKDFPDGHMSRAYGIAACLDPRTRRLENFYISQLHQQRAWAAVRRELDSIISDLKSQEKYNPQQPERAAEAGSSGHRDYLDAEEARAR